MALIDEFLYALGFQADLRGGQAFDEQLQRIGDHGESTRHSLLSTITVANLLSHALEKGAEMAKEVGGEFIRTAKEMEDMKVTFESLYTTAAEGEQKFHWLVNFARANPVMGLDAAKEAFLSLKNNGVEPAAMKAMGDTMAAMPGIGYMLGKDVGELLEGRYAMGGAIAQAGIKLHKSSKGGETSYHGSYQNREGQTIPIKLDISDANKTIEQLTKILEDRFGGTMDKHAKTMTGLIARWNMDWKSFQMAIMDNHVFAAVEDELFSLITQWEAWAKSPDAHQMLAGISQILTLIVKIIGEAIRLTATLAGWFSRCLGDATSLQFVLAALFVAAKWNTIIGLVVKFASGLRDVYAALQLVAEGESIVAVLGALLDPLALIPLLIAGAIFGVGSLIKKWDEFKFGMTTGFLDTFFLGFDLLMVRIKSSLEWMIGRAEILFYEAKQKFHRADNADIIDMKRLQAKYGMSELEYGLQKMQDEKSHHDAGKDRENLIGKVHAAHPDWNSDQIIRWTKRNRPDDYQRLFVPEIKGNTDGLPAGMSPDSLKNLSNSFSPQKSVSSAPAKIDNSVTVHADNITLHSDNPADMAEKLVAGYRETNASLASSMENHGTGGRRY
ncbi:hypothetical protein F3I58_23365 [Pantoea sp. VH_4]|nr:hypothetical protein F3I58_23365 [Pantoea sp. VH_4]